MRHGSNPLKERRQPSDNPARITVGVLNYIPFQDGFFAGQLDALKLCLASLRQHAGDAPFALLVLDNGSCQAVLDFLLAERAAGRIDHLVLNSQNVGYSNGLLQILASAPGEYVFYSDGDVYFREGWMQAELAIVEAFPNVGLVTGVPVRGARTYHTEATRRWVADNAGSVAVEEGDLIPEAWTAEYAEGLGFPGQIDKAFGPDWRTLTDCRLTYQGASAFVGGLPFQFLTTQQAIKHLPRGYGDVLLGNPEMFLDTVLDAAGMLRLSTTQPYVYHIGNRIVEPWLQEAFEKLVGDRPAPLQSAAARRHWFWGRRKVRRLLHRVHRWAFNKHYEQT